MVAKEPIDLTRSEEELREVAIGGSSERSMPS
jgi:hypothetical protein